MLHKMDEEWNYFYCCSITPATYYTLVWTPESVSWAVPFCTWWMYQAPLVI